MNCETVISSLGFSCRDLGEGTLRVWSPFTYTGDGERVGFYVEQTRNGYRVTDGCEALMHAASMGIQLTNPRMEAVRRAVGDSATLSDGGEISAYSSSENFGAAMAAVLNAALAVSHFQPAWKPRQKAESFLRDVERTLENSFGERVLKKVAVLGASGHQLELPLAIRNGVELIYVQPIAASDENTMDWKRVYEAWGRMTDIKHSKSGDSQRLIVLQESANDSEMNTAISLLSDSSPVVRYSRLSAWANQRRA
ncbi:DUF1828 domain-containing protein [Curvibacter sp. PAE-UM]|uniref:DUF1828 domain-containing protein n=1 Tax=Curvibacter sp. PAE-UM TaxID=1714344 RepID=UPI0009E873A3|nr:DUF1828 domain-containing protein [Curvibacter sp. PAE-UM]